MHYQIVQTGNRFSLSFAGLGGHEHCFFSQYVPTGHELAKIIRRIMREENIKNVELAAEQDSLTLTAKKRHPLESICTRLEFEIRVFEGSAYVVKTKICLNKLLWMISNPCSLSPPCSNTAV